MKITINVLEESAIKAIAQSPGLTESQIKTVLDIFRRRDEIDLTEYCKTSEIGVDIPMMLAIAAVDCIAAEEGIDLTKIV